MSIERLPLNLGKEVRDAITAIMGPATGRAEMLYYARRAIEAQLSADKHPVRFPCLMPNTVKHSELREQRGNLSPRLLATAMGFASERSINTIETRDRRGAVKPETRARYLTALAECRAVERAELAQERQRETERGEREHGKSDCD